MSLETMEPNPVWTAGAYPDIVDTLSAHATELEYKIWGGDWCKDCRSQLPDFAAALDEADVPPENVRTFPVEKTDDGDKVGPRVTEYDIEAVPTVVVEHGGTEIVRFVESESVPIAVYISERITDELD